MRLIHCCLSLNHPLTSIVPLVYNQTVTCVRHEMVINIILNYTFLNLTVIMKSLPTLSEADKTNAKRILQELRGHFVPQRHVIFERYKFNSSAKKGDTMDEFIVKLQQLAESCEFGTLKDSLIHHRFVICTMDDIC